MYTGLADVPCRVDDWLDFVVVGGGIAGLATAWSLQTAGHRVTLFEQNTTHALSKCREGVRSTPTMSQILNDWGIGNKLSTMSSPIMQMTCLDGKTGDLLGYNAIDKVRESLPADLRCLQYGELFAVLYDLARDAGVDLFFNTRVIAIDPWQGTVTCEDGRRSTADVIVGADGTESIVRPIVLDTCSPSPDCDNRFMVNLVVPADVARQDQELAALVDGKCWTAWLADDCSMHGALAGPGSNRDYTIGMNIAIHSQNGLEEFPMSLESLKVDLFEPRAQKLLKLSEQLDKTVFNHYEPFDNWVHESGKVVLVGQAAHPIIPSGSHDTCACIEDAMTLSLLFSLRATKSQTPMLLSVYEELRQPRCACVQRYVRRKREVMTLPRGSGQQKRDALLRNQRACQEDELDDDFLCNTYTGFVQVFGFDAREVVQDWWFKWGKSILVRSPVTESEGEDEEEDERDDGPISVPLVVDAEIERNGPTYPIISDPLIGEDEDVVRESETHRRCSLSPFCVLVGPSS